jgi:hypothetical protein
VNAVVTRCFEQAMAKRRLRTRRRFEEYLGWVQPHHKVVGGL